MEQTERDNETSEQTGTKEAVTEAVAKRIWIRSAVLSGILFLLIMYTLYFAATLLIPIVLALLLSLVLSPLVRTMVRWHVPQTLSALVVMLTVAGLLLSVVYAVAQPAVSWIDRAPDELRQLEYKLAWVKEPIETLQEAGQQVDAITDVGEEAEAAPRPPPQTTFSLVETLMITAPTLAYGVAVTFILLFFMLASGDALLNKAVHISPTMHDKRRVVETVRGIQRHVSRYLGTIALINVCVGVLVGTAMYLLEVPNPLLWGVLLAVLNFVPYVGVMIGMAVVTFVSLLTFDEPLRVVLPALAIFAINVVEGQFITPIVAGRRLALSPVAVFLSLLVMGWIWGIIGVLIAVPLLAIVKLVCEEIEALNWLATFLSDT